MSMNVQKQIKAATYGAALMQINIRDLRKLLMVAPPIETQNSLVQSLDRLSTKNEALETICEQKIIDIDQLKQSLLQKAFAGELT